MFCINLSPLDQSILGPLGTHSPWSICLSPPRNWEVISSETPPTVAAGWHLFGQPFSQVKSPLGSTERSAPERNWWVHNHNKPPHSHQKSSGFRCILGSILYSLVCWSRCLVPTQVSNSGLYYCANNQEISDLRGTSTSTSDLSVRHVFSGSLSTRIGLEWLGKTFQGAAIVIVSRPA